MIAGLPGTGIGGLFYLISALLMPVREIYLTCRGKSNRKQWAVVALQLSLALGVIGGFWATGWVLGRILGVAKINLNGSHGMTNILCVKPFVISICVLSGVLLGIEMIGLLLGTSKPSRITTNGSGTGI